MKFRHVYSTPSLQQACECVAEALSLGLQKEAVAVIADRDAQLERVPDDLKDDSATDFIPATLRGAIGGGGIGLIGGLVAAAIPTMGVTLGGAALVALGGAALGTWSSALVGASIPGKVHREFDHRVQAGEVLVALNIEEDRLDEVDRAMQAKGASRIDFEVPAVLT